MPGNDNKLIFVDSNYFVALFNPTDTLNKKATKIAQDKKFQKKYRFKIYQP